VRRANRQGKPCAVKVEPGKRRCRFHGGLSTGPKTAAGRARIAEAQRRRWNAWQCARRGGTPRACALWGISWMLRFAKVWQEFHSLKTGGRPSA